MRPRGARDGCAGSAWDDILAAYGESLHEQREFLLAIGRDRGASLERPAAFVAPAAASPAPAEAAELIRTLLDETAEIAALATSTLAELEAASLASLTPPVAPRRTSPAHAPTMDQRL